MTDYEQAIRDELETHGAVVTRIRAGGKHRRIYFEWDGQEQFYTFAVSPSDHRAMENARSGIRKILGVKRKVHKNPENKTRTRNRTEPKAPPDLACKPAANPFDALAEHPVGRPIAEPRPGYFKMRLVRDGPWLSARLYLPCPMDPEFCGPLDRSRHLLAEVDGDEKPDPWINRIWTSGREIGAAEFHYLRDDAAWCRRNAPLEPRANPRTAMDPRRIAPVMP